MSTTTQILFNSPALHSLKREQLVKLCKIHSIKANGKNVDLIERLKLHAKTLPPDDPLNIASRNEEQDRTDSNHDQDDNNEDNDEDKENGNSGWKFQMPRPSEQWEIVMESIEEESSSQGTLSSMRTVNTNGTAGEFGTGGSKSTSVSSSIKALATSLGLKRNASSKSNLSSFNSQSSFPSSQSSTSNFAFPSSAAGDELTQHAIPYSSLPLSHPDTLPQTDHFTFSAPDVSVDMQATANSDADATFSAPIPGQAPLPGMPAPTNARLSSGGGTASTTIRLVSAPYVPEQPSTPQLRPFETTFDLVAATPGGDSRINIWPASPTAPGERLYPAIPMFDVPAGPVLSDAAQEDDDVDMPGALSPPCGTMSTPSKVQTQGHQPVDIFSPVPKVALETSGNQPVIDHNRLSPLPRSQPFIFGSPLPQHNLSNNQFKTAAASVLDEMNRRLGEAGVDKVEADLLERTKRLSSGVQPNRKVEVGRRFNKAHEEEFSKMDSIATHYAAKRGSPDKKRKASALGVGDGRGPGGKRKSSVGVRAAGARVISNGVRRRMVPGGFDDEEASEEEEGDRRLSKRPRVDGEEGVGEESSEKAKTKKVSIAPSPAPDVEEKKEQVGDEKEKVEKKKQKEREAIRRKLDMNKARRRSSMGRVSVGGGKAPLIPNQKGKGTTSRFGFLSSAKSIVQNVWNRGVGSKATASNIPVSKAAAPKAATDAAKAASLAKKPTAAPARPSTALADSKNATRIASGGSTSSRLLKPSAATASHDTVKSSTATTSRSRSPIPAFGSSTSRTGIASTISSRVSSAVGTGSSRVGTASSSRIGTRSSSVSAAASSMGTRSSGMGSSNVSSLGARSGSGLVTKRTSGSITSAGDKNSIRKRTSSTLMAPTASSLAKIQSSSSSRISSVAVPQDQNKGPGLSSVTEHNPKDGNDEASTSSNALGPITNTPGQVDGTPGPQSPRPKGIFSTPLSPSSIPTPIRNPTFGSMLAQNSAAKPPLPPKPKILPGRKPRISRSRVIAKLASQRAASNSSAPSAGPIASSSRTRSSMGAGVRQSFGGSKAGRGSAGSGVIMSAKKRARQSEYARRRSRVAAGGSSSRSGAMDVDNA